MIAIFLRGKRVQKNSTDFKNQNNGLLVTQTNEKDYSILIKGNYMYRIKLLKEKCVSFVIMKPFSKVWSTKLSDIGGFIQVNILNSRGEKHYWNQGSSTLWSVSPQRKNNHFQDDPATFGNSKNILKAWKCFFFICGIHMKKLTLMSIYMYCL